MPIRAIIFDLDGIITDTAELHYHSWQRLCDEEGIPFDRRRNEHLRGRSRADSLRLILAGTPIDDTRFAELLARKNAYYHELLSHLGPDAIFPGILAFLDELDRAGIPYAVGSASQNVRHVLARLGILSRFAFIGESRDVAPKPAPDLFLQIAEALAVPPAKTIVIEDAAAGIEAALRGGFRVVGIGPRSRVGKAHLILSETRLLTLARLSHLVPS